MKKLHLHIGSPKTGTTSIQNIFHANQEVINTFGFNYPGREINHHLSFLATNATPEDWPRQFASVEESKLEKAANQYFEKLEEEFRADFDEQVISTEYLFIHDKNYISNYLSYLGDFFSNIKVYLFVRNPIDYFRSVQQQGIKARSFIKNPNDQKNRFRSVIEAWSEFCEIEVIEYKKGVDSCKVFCERLGIDHRKLSKPEKKSNTSLSIEQMLLLEKIQRHFYQAYENKFKNHLGVVQHINAPFGSKPQLKPEIQALIYNNHIEDLQWLQEEHGIDFLNEELENHEITSVPTFEKGKATVRDVYKVPSENFVEKYEALVVDALLKKLVQEN